MVFPRQKYWRGLPPPPAGDLPYLGTCLLHSRIFTISATWEAPVKTRQCIKKQRHHFANKGPYSKAMGFPVVMYRCESWTIKKAKPKNWCFWIVVLDETLESPLDCKDFKPVNLRGNQPWIFIKRTVAEAKTPVLGLLMRRADSLQKTLMLEKIEGKRRRK